MPITPQTGVAIAQAGSEALNGVFGMLTNRQNKKNALEMYSRQRNDALTDWNSQNEYNSPAAQMQRYKDAGLNPHLIYGQSHTAAPVRSVNAETPKAQAPQINGGAITSSYFDTKLKGQQVNNMQTIDDVNRAEVQLKKAQTLLALANSGLANEKIAKQVIDNYIAGELKEISIDVGRLGFNKATKELAGMELRNTQTSTQTDYTRANTDKAKADTSFTNNENRRQEIQLQNTLADSLERRLTMKLGRQLTAKQLEQLDVLIENLKEDGILKQYENWLNTNGAQKSDFFMTRQIQLGLQAIKNGNYKGDNNFKPRTKGGVFDSIKK